MEPWLEKEWSIPEKWVPRRGQPGPGQEQLPDEKPGHLLPALLEGLQEHSRLAPWLAPAMNLPLLNVKPAFPGHCAILFTACVWGDLDQ